MLLDLDQAAGRPHVSLLSPTFLHDYTYFLLTIGIRFGTEAKVAIRPDSSKDVITSIQQ